MSRSKEGMDKEKTAAASRQAEEPSQADYLDQRLGAKGQTDYTAGRESWREFPRRSTSTRGKPASEVETRDLYDPSLRREYQSQTGSRFDNRGSVRSESRGSYPDYTRGAGRYGRYGRDRHAESQEYGRYGRHTYEDLRYGRADHEDLPRSQGRYRSNERGQDYDRSDYRQENREYEEPYGREPLNTSYDYRQDFSARNEDYGYNAQRDWRGREANYLRCSDIMTKDVTICSPQTVLREVADKMQDDNVGSIPVVDGGRLVGIITDRDIVCRVIAEGQDTRTTPASAAMSEDLVTCTPDESVIDAIRKMAEHQIRRIPVCDINGRVRGIIAMADIALEAERDRDLASALERISQPTPNRSRRV